MIPPRLTPNRHDYYMGQAFMASAKSKDPNTQVGAVIVTPDNIPQGMGYNGPSRKLDDSLIDWTRPNKNDYIFHAERNAIKFSKITESCTIYVTGKPCKNCMNEIVDAGISKVIYHTLPNYKDPNSMLNNEELWKKSLEIADRGNVSVEVFTGNLDWMKEWIEHLSSKFGLFNIDNL